MGRYGKIKLHFTRDGSRRRSRRSREARPLCGTSWSRPRRGAGSVSPRVPSDMRTGRPGRANGGRTACRDPWPRPPRESLPDPPRGLYRAVTDTLPRGAWVAACEARASGARAYVHSGLVSWPSRCCARLPPPRLELAAGAQILRTFVGPRLCRDLEPLWASFPGAVAPVMEVAVIRDLGASPDARDPGWCIRNPLHVITRTAW
jgi:hypothetical protein